MGSFTNEVNMVSFKQLQKKAKQYSLNLWQNGGYYYLSGLVHGKHTQGIFTTLKSVEKELSDGWKFDKIPDIRTITYSGKQYEIKIEHIHNPPYGLLHINGRFMSSVFPYIRREGIIGFIKTYNLIQKDKV